MFNPDEAKYADGIKVELPYPTNDVKLLTKAVMQAVDHIYRSGFKYSKAEVLLMDLRQLGEYTNDLFAEVQPAVSNKLMGVLDEINGRWGRGTLRTASLPANPDWGMRHDLMSQSYTIRLTSYGL
jgi:DNA polymerase V